MTTITGKQLEAARAKIGNFDRGTTTPEQLAADVLSAVHPNATFDKKAQELLGMDQKAQERSRHKGFRDQAPDIEPRPQVALEFTVPPLPPEAYAAQQAGLPTGETEDAEVAREIAEKGGHQMTGQSATHEGKPSRGR